MTTLRIGELASKGNVNLETIRYYEREGLIRPPQRTSSGHRAYAPPDDLQAIERTLRKMKASCDGRRSMSECPILESLDSGRSS